MLKVQLTVTEVLTQPVTKRSSQSPVRSI